MKRVAVALLMVVACKNGPSQDQCKQLLDHLVDLEFKKARRGCLERRDEGGDREEQGRGHRSEDDRVHGHLQKKMTKSRVDCALAANDLDGENGVGKCDESK